MLIFIIILCSGIVFILSFFLFLLLPPIPLPIRKGGRLLFETVVPLKKLGDEIFYLHNDIPYPGHFEYPEAKRIILDGSWDFSFSPPDVSYIGELSKRDEEREDRQKTAALKETWGKIEVPSTYNAANSQFTEHAGLSWYRRTFSLTSEDMEGRFVRLCFEGLLLRGQLWCNGAFLGVFEGGYSPIYYNLRSTIHPGENELLLCLDNRLTWTSLPPKQKKGHKPGWHTYGGIIRSVYLDILPERYIFKVRTEYHEDRADASIYIFVHTSGKPGENLEATPELKLSQSELNRSFDSKLVGTMEEDGSRYEVYSVPSLGGELAAWDADNPAWYTLSVCLPGLPESEVKFRTGFRSVRCDGSAIKVNRKAVFLKGISKHEDHPDYGASQTEELIREDLETIKAMNANYIRMAHYPHDIREMELTAGKGIYMSEEIPLYQAGLGFTAWFLDKEPISKLPWKTFGLRQLARRKLLHNARDQLIRMVERDRNNPGILIWSMGNECYSMGKTPGKIFGWLADIARDLDSERLTTYVDLTFDIPLMDRWKRAWPGVDVCSQNSYYGWYYSDLGSLKPYLDRMLSRTLEKPVLLSEFGAGALLGRTDAEGEWKAERVPPGRTYSEEYQMKVYEAYWREAMDNPRIQGFSPWVYADFYNAWFPSNPIPNYNLKGIVSRERKPKKSYFLLKGLFTQATGK